MKAKVLEALRKKGEYVSGQELCERFGVSRTAVWKIIKKLKQNGYDIDAVPNKGYLLKAAPDVLSREELISIRNTEWLGKEIFYYDIIDSTNIKAQELGNQGYPHGTLVVADCQSSGKGRRGRTWQSPPHSGIAMTILLKPDIKPGDAPMLTLVAALAVTGAIRELCAAEPKIKWPNDIILNGKKICGILTEMSAQTDYINHIAIGFGVNTHNMDFPEEIAGVASSILKETGIYIRRALLIEKILEYFETYFASYMKTHDLTELLDLYDACLVNIKKEVRVLDPQDPFEGVAMGITKRGALVVDVGKEIRCVSCGEVSVRGIYGYV